MKTCPALRHQKKVEDRCSACGLGAKAWAEVGDAQFDFVSAQARREAVRVYGIADAELKKLVDELCVLRDEMLVQTTFYFTTPGDVQRLAKLREGRPPGLLRRAACWCR